MLLLLACTCWNEFPEDPADPLPEGIAAPNRPALRLPEGLQPLTEITIRDAAGLYQGCLDRVELPEADGECAVDADCQRAGCSGETCAALGADRMTTCEVRLCFHVLDSCGCEEGRCRWSLHQDGEVVPAWTFTGQPALQPVER